MTVFNKIRVPDIHLEINITIQSRVRWKNRMGRCQFSASNKIIRR